MSDPPWLASSDAALVEASSAPAVTPSEIESEPTETRATFADDETEEPITQKKPHER